MKTIFPKKKYHKPKWFIIDATNKTLGRLASEASRLLMGKKNTFFTHGVDQGHFVIIYNAENVLVSGKKTYQKSYFRNSQRPGSLKIETYVKLKNRIPCRIIEKAVWGMLPKGILGRMYYRRLYVYSKKDIEDKDFLLNDKWLKYE